jgi:2-oxo-hept-3-ene-1,7-dioate hydratase
MTDNECQQAAADLLNAGRTRQAIPQLSVTWPDIDLDDAYAIQRLWADARVADGVRIVGHKIGLTSRVMQASSGINEPDYGHLFDDMIYNDGDKIPVNRFLAPRIEVELAFVLGRPLRGPQLTMFDALNATDYIVPAMEIIDYRTAVPRRIFDTIADNGAAAATVMGGRPVRPMDIDIRWVGATLSKNGVIEESGVSAAVMGHPALSIAWLANKLALHGNFLDAGQIVLSGSFTRPIGIVAGDTIHADYGLLGSIGVSFA